LDLAENIGRQKLMDCCNCNKWSCRLYTDDLISSILIVYHLKFGKSVSPRRISDAGSCYRLWTASLYWTGRHCTTRSSMCICNQKKNIASVSGNHGNCVISRFKWRNEKRSW
jgi:hypothetical protein